MLSGVGQFTSACGITYYRGSSFTAEPVHGIVHRDVLADNGSLYLAKRAQDGVEFLASTDAWFRPVNLYIGPDGAMYLMDYYRMIIEHPEWMATKHQHSPDLFKGIDRGRIYRIVPDGAGGPVKGIHLPDSTQDLLKMVAETDSRVRYQLLLTLGFVKSPASQSLRERLLFDNLDDKWFQVAALSASSDDAPRLFDKAVAMGGPETKGRAMLYGYLAAVIGAREKPAEIEHLLQRLQSGWWQAASLDGLNQGLRRKRGAESKHTQDLLLGIFEKGEPKARNAALRSLEIVGLPKDEASKGALTKAVARAN